MNRIIARVMATRELTEAELELIAAAGGTRSNETHTNSGPHGSADDPPSKMDEGW